MESPSQETILTVWVGSLILLAVVAAVVTLLLVLIRKTARQIEGGAAAIWTHGQLVANNTIQIPLLLGATGRVAARILTVVGQIPPATKAIEDHARSCPGCPDCVLNSQGG